MKPSKNELKFELAEARNLLQMIQDLNTEAEKLIKNLPKKYRGSMVERYGALWYLKNGWYDGALIRAIMELEEDLDE